MSQISEGTQPRSTKNDNWNFSVNVIDIIFITLGMSLVSRDTVFPALVGHLTTSTLAVGLVHAIYNIGFYVPQLFMANYTERMPLKKLFVMRMGGFGERGPYLLMGLSIWLFAESSPMLTLIAIYICITITSFAVGLATPAWYDMIAKVIPITRRGLFSGIGSGLGALLGVAGGFWVGYVIDAWDYPTNYSILFFVAFIMTMISWVGLALNREPPSEEIKEAQSLKNYFSQLPSLIARHPNFKRYLIALCIFKLAMMATGFFMVYGIWDFQVDGAMIGIYTATMIGSQALMNLVMGLLGDRFGHKNILVFGAFALALASVSAWLAPSAAWLALSFALLGIYNASDSTSSLNIVLEFCSPADRPTFIGLANTLVGIVITIAPLLGGLLANLIGFQPLFILAALVGIVGASLLFFWVREPRRHQEAHS